ncbi:DUF6701 domain-containing protein [uncultured Pseudoteredinibacter sp.]|uniref:DUF6701 domain-containing protein n=1 Tax=uncultured Pseudoteredinibacter sp. TaxID=1641701 RepID=UPI0026347923|nr:DUF6701 domain-containing protein [uncultured Pseudoteredinibacter sp.]
MLIYLFLQLSLPSQLYAAIILNEDFESPSDVINDWVLSGTYGFPSNQEQAQNGTAILLGPGRAYAYAFVDPPSDYTALRIKFWLRIGHDSFSQTPSNNARVEFQWLNENSSWDAIVIDSGSARAGEVINYELTLPAERIRPSGRPTVSADTFGSRGHYHIDNWTVEAITDSEPERISIQSAQSSASVCVPNQFTFSVMDQNNDVITDFEGILDITTSTANGSWSMSSANGRFTAGAADSGEASYQMIADDQGQVVLQLANQRAESLTVNAEIRGGMAQGQSNTISYADNVFVFDFSQDGKDFIAYRAHNIAVRLMRRDPDTGDCGVASDYNTENLRLRLRGADGDVMQLRSQWIINGDLHGTNNNYSRKPLRFRNGFVQYQLLNYDVGRFTIGIQDNRRNFAQQTISSVSEKLISRPFALFVEVPNNPSAQDHNGGVFVKAGEEFSTQVKAVGWQADDDANADGVADGHNDSDINTLADLSNNPVLASFGNEADPESVVLAVRPFLPVAVSHADLSGNLILSGFSGGGSGERQYSYSNVGIVELSAAISGGSYLGADAQISAKIQGRSGGLGRFVPSHFTISDEDLLSACASTGITHLGQEFEVSAELQAVNLQGHVVDGYHGEFAKLTTSQGLISYQAQQLLNRVEKTNESFEFDLGVASLKSTLLLARTTNPEPPLENLMVALKVNDSDGIELADSELNMDFENSDAVADHALLGSSSFYFSRLNMPSLHGPETEDLLSQLHIESWQGSSFQRNQKASCFSLGRGQIRYEQTGDLSDGGNRIVTIGSGQSTGSYADMGPNHIHFSQGDAGQYFTAPGFGNRGFVDVDINLANYPWLRYDWNQDGSFDDENLPTARFQFGGVRGHDRVVYWRENN